MYLSIDGCILAFWWLSFNMVWIHLWLTCFSQVSVLALVLHNLTSLTSKRQLSMWILGNRKWKDRYYNVAVFPYILFVIWPGRINESLLHPAMLLLRLFLLLGCWHVSLSGKLSNALGILFFQSESCFHLRFEETETQLETGLAVNIPVQK